MRCLSILFLSLEMIMEVESLPIHEVKVLKTKKFGDARGYFSETCNRQALANAGIDEVFIQNSQSLSATRGTVRGLHFQLPPLAQAKLVHVLRGNIPNVAIDWPVAPADAVLSAKDLALPALADLPDCFFREPMDSDRGRSSSPAPPGSSARPSAGTRSTTPAPRSSAWTR